MANICIPTAFKARFTEFTNVNDARIQVFIDDALLVLDETTWGDLYSQAACYLSAHYLALAEESALGSAGNVGSATARAVDGTSISFNAPTLNNVDQAYYLSTQYGQRFYSLIKSHSNFCTPFTISI